MNVGYARVSSKDQNLDRQIAAINLRNDAVNKIKSTVEELSELMPVEGMEA